MTFHTLIREYVWNALVAERAVQYLDTFCVFKCKMKLHNKTNLRNAIYNMQFTICNLHYAIYIMQFTICHLQYAIYIMPFISCNLYYALYIMQFRTLAAWLAFLTNFSPFQFQCSSEKFLSGLRATQSMCPGLP